MKKSRVVVCLSGGTDSILCCEIARVGLDTELAGTLFLDYGQPAVIQELAASDAYCRLHNVSMHVVRADLQGMFEMNAAPGEPGLRVVPGRNGIILSFAFNLAAAIDADQVWYGAIRDDLAYADCTPAWVECFDRMAGLGWKKPIKVCAPLIELNKGDVLERLLKAGVSMQSTWSCYAPISENQPCEQCNSCILFRDSLNVARYNLGYI